MRELRSILVYCGANAGNKPVYRDAAIALGNLFVQEKITLVYGGGSIGIMGIIADSMLGAGGKVIGVIPDFLNVKEVGHTGLTEMHVVQSMHERKAKMETLCDGVIVLPGGYGTFDEMFEMLTWSQLGLHRKPIGILNVNGYYDPLLAQLDKMVEEGFLSVNNRKLLIVDADLNALMEKMRTFDVKTEEKWMDRGES
jgi:uncharacterized protein (TIGR00730 family)